MENLRIGQKVKIKVARYISDYDDENYVVGIVKAINNNQVTVHTEEFGLKVYPIGEVSKL